MTSIPPTCEVAIVGAGPTGLAAALLLQKLGVDTFILEAREQPQLTSRATVIHSRTLEVLESVDLTEDLLRHSHRIEKLGVCGNQETLASLNFTSLKAKYNCAISNPQNDTESLFAAKFESAGGRIFRGAKVTSTKQSVGASHTLLSLQYAEGRVQTLRTKYIIAADGLHSPIRESYSIPFEGADYNLLVQTAELRIAISNNDLLDPSQAKICMTPWGIAFFVPQPSGLWRLYTTINPTPKYELVDKNFYQFVVNEAVGEGLVIEEMAWTAPFHISHRLAKRYREGRVFLAGDAAHVHSPAGGQGMNTGIQDGISLAKTLSEALKIEKADGDPEACLDQYEKDRRPVAEGVVALTHRMTILATMTNPVPVMLRNMALRLISQSTWLTGIMARRLAQYPELEA